MSKNFYSRSHPTRNTESGSSALAERKHDFSISNQMLFGSSRGKKALLVFTDSAIGFVELPVPTSSAKRYPNRDIEFHTTVVVPEYEFIWYGGFSYASIFYEAESCVADCACDCESRDQVSTNLEAGIWRSG